MTTLLQAGVSPGMNLQRSQSSFGVSKMASSRRAGKERSCIPCKYPDRGPMLYEVTGPERGAVCRSPQHRSPIVTPARSVTNRAVTFRFTRQKYGQPWPSGAHVSDVAM